MPENKGEKLSRRDFLKVAGATIAGGVLGGIVGGRPEVQEGIRREGAELYESLADGRSAVRLEKFTAESGKRSWDMLLRSPGSEGSLFTPVWLEDGRLALNPESTEVPYIIKPAIATLFYDPESEIGPRVRVEVGGKRLQIAKCKVEVTDLNGKLKTYSSFQFVDEKGKYLGDTLRFTVTAPFLFAATKEMTERGYDSVSAVMGFMSNKKNGDLLGLDFLEIWSEEKSETTEYPIIKGARGSKTDYYQPEWTGTGFRYFFENRPLDVLTGRVEPLPETKRIK